MGQGPADRYVHWTLEGIAKDDPLTENGNVLLTCWPTKIPMSAEEPGVISR